MDANRISVPVSRAHVPGADPGAGDSEEPRVYAFRVKVSDGRSHGVPASPPTMLTGTSEDGLSRRRRRRPGDSDGRTGAARAGAPAAPLRLWPAEPLCRCS